MATLLKQDNWYYSQFYDKHRSPQRKRIALKTKTKRAAQCLHQQLEDRYARGQYDPWTGYDATSSNLPVCKHFGFMEVLDFERFFDGFYGCRKALFVGDNWPLCLRSDGHGAFSIIERAIGPRNQYPRVEGIFR